MTRRVNQVDQKAGAILGLLNEGQVIVTQLVEQGDGAAKEDNLLDMTSDVKCHNLSVTKFGRNPLKLVILLLLFKKSQLMLDVIYNMTSVGGGRKKWKN